jgi:hypothetical protein
VTSNRKVRELMEPYQKTGNLGQVRLFVQTWTRNLDPSVGFLV